MSANGDTDKTFSVNGNEVVGLGSFHKTLLHDNFGEVDGLQFKNFVSATRGGGNEFFSLPTTDNAPFTNPQAGLAHDRLTDHPSQFDMPPAPSVLSFSTAAEMTELYWMAELRDQSLHTLSKSPKMAEAIEDVNSSYTEALKEDEFGGIERGVDLPGGSDGFKPFTSETIFRAGLPGEEFGGLISQFFLRDIPFGTQTISQLQHPYKTGRNYLTKFEDWLVAQNTGVDENKSDYRSANEFDESYFEPNGLKRYISTMRDLARFVNKDALHQAYFNAALVLLNGKAKWCEGNPYRDDDPLTNKKSPKREAGFGTLGGPHILALVSEVATRALKVVWHQKWQVHLRLRPEAYGGLVHVQTIGVKQADGSYIKREYSLPDFLEKTAISKILREHSKADGEESLLLPMAFSPGSPTHPAYGAGHATVAGACVTVLKAFFATFESSKEGMRVPAHTVDAVDTPIDFATLRERAGIPYGTPSAINIYRTGVEEADKSKSIYEIDSTNPQLTIEGELNKIAANVALGRSMGGVHWRTDNTRSLRLGEFIASHILADITKDLNEECYFAFRTFARGKNNVPRKVVIRRGQILVDGKIHDSLAGQNGAKTSAL